MNKPSATDFSDSMSVKNAKHAGGRPTKRTASITAKIAEAISFGLTDQEAADIAKIDDLTLTRWRRIPEFCRAIKSAVAARKLVRLKRIDAGKTGWQGSAWALERQDPARFARPEILLQNVLTQNGAPAPPAILRIFSIPDSEFEQCLQDPAYQGTESGAIERTEGAMTIRIFRQSKIVNHAEEDNWTAN